MRLRTVHALSGCLAALLPVVGDAELSQKIRSEIVAPLPVYTPPAPEAPKPTTYFGAPAPLSDEPYVRLPNYRVEDKRVPVTEPDAWLGPTELKKKQMREYKKSMTSLEWALNSWSIPFITPPASARAKSQYDSNRMAAEFARLNGLADAIAKIDPAAAKQLKAALDPNKLPKN